MMELLAVPLATSLFAFGVCAIVTHALVLLTSRASTFKKYTAKQMLIALLNVLLSSFSAGGRVVVRAGLADRPAGAVPGQRCIH